MNSRAKACFTASARSLMRFATRRVADAPRPPSPSAPRRCRGRCVAAASSPMVGSGFSLGPLGLQPVAEGEAAGAPGARRPTIGPSLIDQTKSTHFTIAGKRLFEDAVDRRSAARASRARRRWRRPSRSSRRSRDISRDADGSGRERHAAMAPSARWSAITSRSHLRKEVVGCRADSRRSRQRPARRPSSRAARRAAGSRSALR